MYLARRRDGSKTHYSIRHSYATADGYLSRELFDLGTEPAQYIIYPGGNAYYYDPVIEDALTDKGINTDPFDLDRIFHEFLPPHIQRIIAGFDRSQRRRAGTSAEKNAEHPFPVHIFDQRRYHYLRFGHSSQQHIHRVSASVFEPLQRKSRDELEHYFLEQERRLPINEKPPYVAVIFQLNQWSPDIASPQSWLDQMDACFIDRLCRLNADHRFMSGVPEFTGLSAYLIRYVISYFDTPMPARSAEYEYIRDFINRHRVHRPPASVQVKIDEAEKLFGRAWKELQQMSEKALTRLYRRQALKYHPDHGGTPDAFRRLTKYYKALLSRKPRS